MSAGYSGTPLNRKLGLGPGLRLRVVNAPDHYADLVAPLPEGVVFATRISPTVGLVHHFTTSHTELAGALARYRAKLAPDAVVWVSWPKKSSGVASTVTEDIIRRLALPLGFVDVKVCAVDAVWSGLKLVVRKELRGA
ncbi:DUF3052 domain-containing protein [bacterium]|nr:DUF3052 domain-containing protein [bacterium]